MDRRGITLIELLISIAITVIIAGAIYLGLNAALESWGYSKDKLALQKVLNDVTEEITNGIAERYGVRDGLEITAAGSARVEFVPPWTDDTHTVRSKDFVYTLDNKLKPGAAVPITEVKLPEASSYMLAGSALFDQKDARTTQLRLTHVVTAGSEIRFTYHPDPGSSPDTVKSIWWDEEEGHIYTDYYGETENISKNMFGVRIVDFRLRYYDNMNNLVTESDWVDKDELIAITGVEVFVTAGLDGSEASLLNFTSLRNAPMHSGFIPLEEGMKIPIPDSHDIHILQLGNIMGVDNEDVIILEAKPERGKDWVIEILFSRTGFAQPKVRRYAMEYPSGRKVFEAFPGLSTRAGLNLLLMDASGLYDYDDDQDVEDVVILEGDVTLEVVVMDIKGCSLFVKP